MKKYLEIEKKCIRCGDYWPADTDFFYRKGPGLHSYCKACCAERTRELRLGYPRKIKLYVRKFCNVPEFESSGKVVEYSSQISI